MAPGFANKVTPYRTKISRTQPDGHQPTIVVDLNEVVKRGRKGEGSP